MEKPTDHISRLGVDAPSGDLVRDLKDGKRVLLRRGQPCLEVRAAPELGERVLKFIASTDGIKRDGNRVRNDRDSWDFTNFSKNPVMLWTHDYGSSDRPPMPPIGSWVDWAIEPDTNGRNALVMSGKFATHEFADLVYNLYLEGHMRAVSIGWTPLEYQEILDGGKFVGWDFTRNELLECSAVPIPADPDAIMVAAQRGLIPERSIPHFANWLAPSRGIAYVLDSRDRPETRSDAASCSVDFAGFWAEVAQAAEMSERVGPARAEGEMIVTCPACGADAPENANYCPMCGASLKDSEGKMEPMDTEPTDDAVARDDRKATPPQDGMLEVVSQTRGYGEKMWKKVTRMCDMAERCWSPMRAEGVEVSVEVEGEDAEAEDPAVAAATAAEGVMQLAGEIVGATQMIYEAIVAGSDQGDTEAVAEQAASLKARIGKKISKGRMTKLEDAHNTIRSGVKYLREVLDEVKDEMADGPPSAPADEASELRSRIEELISRKETLLLKRKVEDLVERKERLKEYASALLPGRK